MKTIGLIGGVSWESSAEYYRLINELTKERLGGLHSSECVMSSLNFAPVAEAIKTGDNATYRKHVLHCAERLKGTGADLILICSNTTHAFAKDVETLTGIPVLHIADAVGKAIREKGLKTVGLLGTKKLMEADYVSGRLEKNWGLTVLIPDENDRKTIDRVIFDELCQGKVIDSSRALYLEIMDKLANQGAEGIILGCTEIPMLVKQEHTHLIVFDSLELHARAAVDLALDYDDD